MKFGNFIIFERKSPPPQAPVFGLKQAEAIFTRANGHIKGDVSGAVPFAIMSTAEVLGAKICIEEECAAQREALETSAEEKQALLQAVTRETVATIQNLELEIRQSQMKLTEVTHVLNAQTDALRSRQDEIRNVQNFFMMNSE